MNREFRMKFESLLRKALRATHRGDFYLIDADYFGTPSGIFTAVGATLTALQYEDKNRGEIVNRFLDNNSIYLNDNTPEQNWDIEKMEQFYENTKAVIEDLK